MSTSTKKSALQEIFDAATSEQKLRIAKLVRAAYVKDIANTKQVLDPARLRALDANIAKHEAELN